MTAPKMDFPAYKKERVDALTPYTGNARTHSETQIALIAASIREFGWTNPILVDGANGIIAGHGRVLAARTLGMIEVPIIELGHLSEAQKRAYVIADNKLALNAGWDDDLLRMELGDLRDLGFDLALTGFDLGEINELLVDPTEGLTDPDDIPPAPARPVTRRGDLWLLGQHRLLCGDSTSATDVNALMQGERAVLFATDPPYLVDYDGTNHPTSAKRSRRARLKANKDWSEEYIEQPAPPPHWDDSRQGPAFYEAFMKTAIDHAIADDAAWYCWHASRRQAMLEACWQTFDVLHHQQIIWVKSRAVLTRSVLLWAHEPCMFGWRTGRKPRVNRKGFDRWPTTVWEIPSKEIETRDHPTSKPVRVFTLPMELHTGAGDVCYEPFAGSGSQHIAGERTGRRVYGLELSETFCDVAVLRWQAFTGQEAVLLATGQTYGQAQADRVREVRHDQEV